MIQSHLSRHSISQMVTPNNPPTKNSTIFHFTLREKIGHGGYSDVYKAIHI